jgi:peptide chain release factor 2
MSNDAALWEDGEKAKTILKEKSSLEAVISRFNKIENSAGNCQTAFELVKDGGDSELEKETLALLHLLEELVSGEEFILKMSQPFDQNNAILEVNSGSGGTEAQDWAEMLQRMYLRWAERKGYATEELDYQVGDGAGIKRATYLISGDYAYGHLRSEQGVHRLVRISPFDSNARRHTSFASISITPDIEEDIEIDIEDKDLRVDTYRSSGAGGQHVNKTDSAVRLTHIPTGIVIACQNERSQHKNRDRAMKILKAKLYELEISQQQAKIKSITGERKQIDFGSQIRSYVLQPYKMIKDLRTDVETSNVDAVLNGDIDLFIESYLMSQAK